ncbi:ribosome biogenesis GTP-binding protein YihA/YsxC [Clostridium tetani]|uniref:Probable GTP-binding protein EngB n=1 Tax=Clostridium tetani TaxID=1513 RepID=A0A4Q0VD52_CLOTA|nr:ribosome biogenesis GTP-binding protein YihA/YsxC [Clostridium tetani]KGI45083.1 GTP-binding protein [Clostridium tetani]RXI47418.1 YihA family ribosome biogenesis GTP-binding protein [Clostridium tetani]RXI48910.1 YihA family ribosome biogenesis GTP-binding protein [Clostridium tetani]RXI73542.1 YihA family ribosome biogenesis GTP-binding protein [Clostridium tetani]RXI77762.1 YihA family ribosome biogenesis GTP-binding protein [Clostridium tetani]
MEIKQSEFITSAKVPSQYPEDNRIEVAFVGRSNVGKSSLINSLTNRRKLVKVSGKPGKTRLINFFLINNDFYFVDLPGYGYARVSKEEKKNWGKTIETYLTDREQLKKIILLVDSRHKPTNDDVLMCNWIKYYGYDISVVATKSDKLKRSELKKNEKIIRDTLDLSGEIKIIFHSTLNKSGREELLEDIFKTCNID